MLRQTEAQFDVIGAPGNGGVGDARQPSAEITGHRRHLVGPHPIDWRRQTLAKLGGHRFHGRRQDASRVVDGRRRQRGQARRAEGPERDGLDAMDEAASRQRVHALRELRDRRGHCPLLDCGPRLGLRVEAHHHDLAGLAGGGDRFHRAERHQVAAREECVDVGVCLQDVLKDVEALVALPVGRLRCDDLDAGRLADDFAESFQPRITRFVPGDALEHGFPMVHRVGRAAAREAAPRLIELEWGASDHPRVAVVGKGVCFDSGGLDIKPSSGMLLMKKDMGGAAHALALAQLVMGAKLPVRLHVLVPAVENAIAGNAFRPGDVLHLGTEPPPQPLTPLRPELHPTLTNAWTIGVLYGPHGAPDFFTKAFRVQP